MLKRYRLTNSGVCDCMVVDEKGPWIKFSDIIEMLGLLNTTTTTTIIEGAFNEDFDV